MKRIKPAASVWVVLSAMLLICTAAFADEAVVSQPIVGSIDFGGTITFNTTSLSTATQVTNWNSSFVLQGTGDFSSIAFGTHSVMASPWIFNSGTVASPSAGPATPGLWSVGGFVFDLSSAVVSPGQTSNFLHVTGTGTVSSSNQSFLATPGVWSFTVSNSNGQDQTTFGFQANTTAVPEPGSLALMTVGIASVGGIAWSRRKQRKV